MKLKTITQFLLFFIILFCVNTLFGQNQLVFAYDAAGNQQERQLICVNCTQAKANKTNILNPKIQDSLAQAQMQALKTQDSLALVGRQLSAYPNPLTEVLNVKWYASDKTYISQINVYSILGVRFYHQTFLAQQNQVSISFLSLSSGLYVMQAIYNDGRQENIKVVKE